MLPAAREIAAMSLASWSGNHYAFDRYDSDRSVSSQSSNNSSSDSHDDDDDYDEPDVNDAGAFALMKDHGTTAAQNGSPNANNAWNNKNNSIYEYCTNLWSRTIVHLDVDCFYCQCEEVEGRVPRDRPVAIGQKHIIVTCNYIARNYGVQKLQSRESAYAACSSLLIVEGSDLERYRRHSRRIYLSFRQAWQDLAAASVDKQQPSQQDSENNEAWTQSRNKSSFPSINVPVRRGGMDENFADLTDLVGAVMDKNNQDRPMSMPSHAFVYGQDKSSARVVVVEAQSGARATVHHSTDNTGDCGFSTSASVRESVHHVPTTGTKGAALARVAQNECMNRLAVAAALCEQVRQRIYKETGFTVTLGVSVSPLLAKLTSDLHKPNSLNVLFPWRSASILLPMPLRKVPSLGNATLRALQSCLQCTHSGAGGAIDQKLYFLKNDKESSSQKQEGATTPKAFWTCHDLLKVPQWQIESCLQTLVTSSPSRREGKKIHHHQDVGDVTTETRATTLRELCLGLDTSQIEDDNGGLTKQVSVEDSFQRGTNVTRESVWKAMESLFVRLPILVDERQEASPYPERAFPTTLRCTARVVDPAKLQQTSSVNGIQKVPPQGQKRRRRPFVTRSKQCRFDGKSYLHNKDPQARRHLLKSTVEPLLKALVFCTPGRINVTRLNLAVTNFQDMEDPVQSTISPLAHSRRILSTPGKLTQDVASTEPPATRISSQLYLKTMPTTQQRHDNKTGSNMDDKGDIDKNADPYVTKSSTVSSFIDSSVLAELPADIRVEVEQELQAYPHEVCAFAPSLATNSTSSSSIDPSVLAELPADIRTEIEQQLHPHNQSSSIVRHRSRTSTTTSRRAQKKSRTTKSTNGTIDAFFLRKT